MLSRSGAPIGVWPVAAAGMMPRAPTLKAFAERNALAVSCVFRFQDLMDNHSDCYVGDAGVGMSPQVKRLQWPRRM